MKYRIILLILLIVPAFLSVTAQKKGKKVVISGVVRDASQKPVSGAIILVDNKKSSVTTDAGGSYKIRVSPDASTIAVFVIFSGSMTEEKIGGRTTIDFNLGISGSGASQGIPEGKEQVNIGYGTVEKSNLTSPVGSIDGQNTKYASYTNIYDMLRGEVPGVQVTGKNIVIQGPTSINYNAQPLFVVDGVVVESIDDIRPQMVSSIEILKGSSASIYGSRGSNGVILINLIGAARKK